MVRNIEKLIHFIVCWTLWLTGMFYYVRKQWLEPVAGSQKGGPPLFRLHSQPRVTAHQAEESLKRQTPLRIKLDRLAFYAKLQIYFILILYIPMIIKYLIVIPLDSELFKEYRYLDCFLFGRFYFYGRTDRANKYIAVMGVTCALIYRLCFARFSTDDFKYYALEFLFRGYNQALFNESKFRHYNSQLVSRTTAIANKRNNSHPIMEAGHFTFNDYRNKTELLYLIEDSSYLFERSSRFYIRPSRSSQSWLRLANFMLVVFGLYATLITSWTLMLYVVHTPAVITKLGYELSYPNCIDWIGRQSNPMDYEFIYDMSRNYSEYIRTARNLPFVLPLVDLIQFNSFHQCRIILEMFDNHLIAWDMLYSFSVHASVVFLIAYDLYLNKQQIGLELVALIGQKSVGKQQTWIECHRSANKPTPTFKLTNPRRQLASNSKIIELQAIIVDHFNLISKYNHYVSFHSRFVICIWVAYTAIVCVWISMVDDSSLKLELTVGEMIVVGLVFANLTGASFVRKNNIKLYHLIATIMALDDNYTTKMRWTTILQFYHPKPLYCMSLFSSIEVSFLFCLKLLSWVATVLLVYVSFLFLYKQ